MKATYITPAVTVLKQDGTVDLAENAKVYEHLIRGKMDGILILGSIGEFFALTMDEKKKLIDNAIKTIDHRVELLVGTTSMVFDEIIELSRYSKEAGADAVIVLPPYYFPLTEEQVEDYFGRLAAEMPDVDIYIYNFPDRTGYDISPETLRNLAVKYPNIMGCKDTQAGMSHTREVIKQVKPVRPDFKIYSGFDDNFAHNILAGGDGCISGISNVYPELCSGWAQAFRDDNMEEVAEIQKKIDSLMDIYAIGSPFITFIKETMKQHGVITETTCSFPFPQANEKQKEAVKELLNRYNL